MSKKNSVTALVLGIVGCVLGVNGWETYGILAIGGLVCSIISMNFQKKCEAEGVQNGMTKAAKITSIIGLVFSILGIVGGLICGICLCTAAAAGGAEALLNGYY